MYVIALMHVTLLIRIYVQASLLPQVERYLKQSIVDKDAHVASAALISGIHLIKVSPDLVCDTLSHFLLLQILILVPGQALGE
jgi:hypothetical protein